MKKNKWLSVVVALLVLLGFMPSAVEASAEYTREEHISYYDDWGQLVGEWHKDCFNNYATWGETTSNSVLEQWDHCEPIEDPGSCTLQWYMVFTCSGQSWGMTFTGCKTIYVGTPHCEPV